MSPRLRPLARFAPLGLATGLLAFRSIDRIFGKLGHPGASLDDAYIHFQYARAIAEGHPFRFQAGEPISTGATSLLWPALLAPFYALGLHGESILWAAWILSYAALGALAYEAYALTRPLTARGPAVGAGAMVLAFGGFAWFAASGMEAVPFAWLMATASRRAAEWAEEPARRTRRSLLVLLAFALLCPLMRPEGALTTLAVALVAFACPRPRGLVIGGIDSARIESAPFVLAAFVPHLFLLLLTGSATSSTAQVKLLAGNPYFVLSDAALANAQMLVTSILDGGRTSTEFLPSGGAAVALLGLLALAWRGHAAQKGVRAALVLLIALSMFVPCFYVTFLWNRLRYLWPFATGWFVGLACLAYVVGDIAKAIDQRLAETASTLAAGFFAGCFAVRLDWVIEDVAQSASEIDRQQVALGHWAKQSLPSAARIGVNDTGAIAYFSDRKTFDVVGLTTATEGRYWVAGAGSRLEHYERLRATAPNKLPTHFIVYPEWMACAPVIGATLREAAVPGATILGGEVMRASEARWDHLGSGEKPWTTLSSVVDSLDIADLESEAEHGYQLDGAHDGEQTAEEGNAPDGAVVVDGGRTNRVRDRFFVKLPAERLVALARVESSAKTALVLSVDGEQVGRVEVEAGPWLEVAFEIPAARRRERSEIEIRSEGAPFGSFHYWFGTR